MAEKIQQFTVDHNKVFIRLLKRDELTTVGCWVNSEQWNLLQENLEFYFDLKSSTFVGAEYDGNLIGCLAGFMMDANTAFSGVLIVKDEFRNGGVGTKLRRHLLRDSENLNIFAMSIEHQVNDTTMRKIFKISDFKTISYRGPFDKLKLNKYKIDTHDVKVVPIDESLMNQVISYDASISTIPRPDYLHKYLKNERSVTYVATQQSSGEVLGFGTLWPAEEGYKMSPLYANTPDIAKMLIYKLLCHLEDESLVAFTVPSCNKAACAMVNDLALPEIYTCIRMYTKSDIITLDQKIFSVSTLEAHIV